MVGAEPIQIKPEAHKVAPPVLGASEFLPPFQPTGKDAQIWVGGLRRVHPQHLVGPELQVNRKASVQVEIKENEHY